MLMIDRGADAFLTCVVRRSEKDSIIRIGALILIMVVTPLMSILLTLDIIWVYNRFIADPSEVIELPTFLMDHMDDFAGAHLMEYTIGTFLLYLIFKAYLNHNERDIVWMDSLITYVKSYGRDTEDLIPLRNKIHTEQIKRVTRSFLIWFAFVLVVCMLQALFISLRDMQPHIAVMTINIFILIMIIQLSFTTIYIYRHISMHAKLQHVFTQLFTERMSDMFPDLGTMKAEDKAVPLWKFVVPMILTLGLFSIFSTMWSIHLMNNHIRDQWEYEERLVRLIARQEKAIGVEMVRSDRKKTLAEKIYMALVR